MKNLKYFLLLHLIIFIYSLGTVASKYAAGCEMFSFKFFLYYGLLLLSLFVYAIAWQQLLKKMPLVFAYANKSATILWGLVFASLIFKETISITNIIGAVIVAAGIVIIVTGDRENA